MRGFLAGLVMGLVVSGLVLGAASVLVDLSERAALRDAAPAADAVEVPPGSGFDAVREDRAAALPGGESSPEPRAAPRVPPRALAPDDTGGLRGPESAPVEALATGDAAALAPPPEEGQGAGAVAGGGERPARPRPQALAPDRPEADARLSIPAKPARPPSPDPGAPYRSDAPGVTP